jgi:hypothetical protein
MLDEKRKKIRLIQQRKVSERELVDLAELPQEIPVMLSIGHRVYTHITQPEEGVFAGTVAAVDPDKHTYRVVFDRTALGSRTVPDYEIKSITPVQTIPIRVYMQTFRPKAFGNLQHPTSSNNKPAVFSALNSPNIQAMLLSSSMYRLTPNLSSVFMEDLNNPAISAALMQNVDPMLGLANSPFNFESMSLFQTTPVPLQATVNGRGNSAGAIIQPTQTAAAMSGMLGGYPIHLLLMITRLSKILEIKKESVRKLSELNAEAERIKANNGVFTKEFQMNYAILVLDLEKLNKDLSEYLNGVQRFCEEYSTDFRLKINSKNELEIMNGNETLIAENKRASMENDGSSSSASTSVSVSPSASSTQEQMTLMNDLKSNYLRESARLVNKKNRKRRVVKNENGSNDEEDDEEDTTENENTENEDNTNGKIEDNLNKINLNETVGVKAKQSVKDSGSVAELRVKSKRSLDLIVRLTSLLLQLKDYVNATSREDSVSAEAGGQYDRTRSAAQFLPFCTRIINESIAEIKQGLSSKENAELFEDRIQVHINHMQSVLCHYNKLHAFKYELDH